MLKVSVFYLETQKSFIPRKKDFLSHCQYQNKKALFTDPIFSEGFAVVEDVGSYSVVQFKIGETEEI